MRLAAIAHRLKEYYLEIDGPLDRQITNLTYDSRTVINGSLFVAVRGLWVDGHKYIDSAIKNGAVAVISESEPNHLQRGKVTWIQVRDSEQALGLSANIFYGEPSSTLDVLAVTGTNGKTTVSWLLYQILLELGVKPGLIGTVEHRFGQVRRKTPFTTPPSADLHRTFGEMVKASCTHVALEASSHGLAQQRLSGVHIKIAGFTNLSRDHLDYHGSMEAYRQAKWKLFEDFADRACFNVDDEVGRAFSSHFKGKQISISLAENAADILAREIKSDLSGTRAIIVSPEGSMPLHLPLVGIHNLENALVALGMAVLSGYTVKEAVSALKYVTPAPGRMELVPGNRQVFVDYAHTPDALESVLTVLSPLTRGRLFCLFGAGGDRDQGKRPEMGRAVSEIADVAIVTSDNPRTEDPDSIIAQICTGMTDRVEMIIEPDRKQAIETAVNALNKDDVLLIAGKGHESYQLVGETRLDFDDRIIASSALSNLP
jgi:UDP-N-acetylmuramoyl-L-alanyl-D-glutamate--2,6-diaminopimelate ligase